jgi:N-acyl homoserine lactone hydrolase
MGKEGPPVPSVEVVLRGMSVTSSEGNYAPCGVYLIRCGASDGTQRFVIYDFGHTGRRLKLLAALDRRGVAPDDVEAVVVSHAHWDHVQNVDVFRNARVLVHSAELGYVQAPHPGDHATPGWTRALLDGPSVQACEDGDEVAPGIRVVHLPGHTPGSIGLAVDTDGGTAVISGDAVGSAQAAVSGQCPNVFWDAGQADASVRRVLDLADCIYPGHDRPFRLGPDRDVRYLTEVRPLTVWVSGISPSDVTVTQREPLGRTAFGHAAQSSAGAVR